MATSVTYTFEAPNFTLGAATPLLNRAPNVNAATGFLASFTDVSTPNGYTITNVDQSGVISGQALIELIPFTDALTLVFNMPVDMLTVDFAINAGFGSGAFLRLVTPSGTTNQVSANVGGPFPGGTLTFSTAIPFLTATLQGFDGTGQGTQIEIDDLQLQLAGTGTAVPEPASLLMLGSGLVAMGIRRRRYAASKKQ
jgi:hypothetical protein